MSHNLKLLKLAKNLGFDLSYDKNHLIQLATSRVKIVAQKQEMQEVIDFLKSLEEVQKVAGENNQLEFLNNDLKEIFIF